MILTCGILHDPRVAELDRGGGETTACFLLTSMLLIEASCHSFYLGPTVGLHVLAV